MENLNLQQSRLKITREQKKQAYGSLAPTVSAFGRYTEIEPLPPGGFSAFTRINQYSYGLTLEQPLLVGGAFSGLNQSKEQVLLQKYQNQTDLSLLYRDFAVVYYNLFYYQRDLENLKELQRFSNQRLKDIVKRVRLGKSRKGERLQAKAQSLRVESQVEEGRALLLNAEGDFKFYTGLKSVPALNIKEEKTKDVDLSVLAPEIKAKSQAVRVFDQAVRAARGNHWPRLSFSTNYFFLRTGVLADSRWDIALNLTFPLFEGGVSQSQVRESIENRTQAKLELENLKRQVDLEVGKILTDKKSLIKQKSMLLKALKQSKQSYESAKKDYSFGLVTNLEVLQTLNFYIETKRAYDKVLSQIHLNYHQLKSKLGKLP